MQTGCVTLYFDGPHPPSYFELLAHLDLTLLAKVSYSNCCYPGQLTLLSFCSFSSWKAYLTFCSRFSRAPSVGTDHTFEKNKISSQYKSGLLFSQLRSCVLLSLLLLFSHEKLKILLNLYKLLFIDYTATDNVLELVLTHHFSLPLLLFSTLNFTFFFSKACRFRFPQYFSVGIFLMELLYVCYFSGFKSPRKRRS